MKKLGHRGCIKKNAPYQNSMEAFKLAIQHGDGFETDACVSKNGDIFFIHEEINIQGSQLPQHIEQKSIQAVGDKHLSMLSTLEVQALKLKDGQPIPQWSETIALFTDQPNKVFNIEIKGEHAAPAVINKLKQAIDEHIIQPNQILVSSFNHPALLQVRKALPYIKIGALFMGHKDKLKPLLPTSKGAESYYFPFSEDHFKRDIIHQIKPDFIVVPHTELTDIQVNLIKKWVPKARLIVWTCGEYNNLDINSFNTLTKKYADDGILDSIIIDELV
ncbi:MAG: glycerophosphoryl diester phosphodiesterase [Alphaproteobacteria bacterium]|jgi:glycerophosphoryl diester phosphodiesterase